MAAFTLQTSVRTAPGFKAGPQFADKIQCGLRGYGQHDELRTCDRLLGRVGQIGDRGRFQGLNAVPPRFGESHDPGNARLTGLPRQGPADGTQTDDRQ